MRALLAPIKFLGRMTAWVAFAPLGFWLSRRHGRREQARLTAKAMRDR